MQKNKKRLFGTSGLRGVTLREITPQLALNIGLSYGVWLNKNGKNKSKICIGFDPRYGAELIADLVRSGLSATGHQSYNLGIVPTGQFAFTVSNTGSAGGVLVTGSHMPHDRVGIIIFMEDGTYAPFEVTDEIEEILHGTEKIELVQLDQIGRTMEYQDLFSRYVNFLYSCVDTNRISKKKFKILIDPVNGSSCKVIREIFERLQTEVSIINHNFLPVPNRRSEPTPETLEEAKNIMKVIGFDLAVCFDVDADRAVFIDENGNIIPPDIIGAVFALHILRANDICVVPINSSGLISELADRTNFKLKYCKIGQPETIKAIKKYKARFSYEESGKYYFCNDCLWSDGIFTAFKLLEILASQNKTLSELVEKVPQYHQMKTSVEIDPLKLDLINTKLMSALDEEFMSNNHQRVAIDGTKLIFSDNSSLMVRFSGTEPLLRLYCDGRDQEKVSTLFNRGKKILKLVSK
ncbi:MAG: hypothetical protein HY606_05780 [Planctomycetes bacterium]|nr:hypothetical protein [Planctomycetota bacterium]